MRDVDGRKGEEVSQVRGSRLKVEFVADDGVWGYRSFVRSFRTGEETGPERPDRLHFAWFVVKQRELLLSCVSGGTS